MNWHLLAFLFGAYTTVFFLLGWAGMPGIRHMQRRFQENFGCPISDEAIVALSPEQRSEWERIYSNEYSRTPYRWIEVVSALFHYPSIIFLGALLKRDTLGVGPMYCITGVTYITAFYFFLR